MACKFVVTQSAEKDLKALEKQNAVRVLQKVREYCALENPLQKAKKLKGFTVDTWRFRVGDYRIVFRMDKEKGTLVILVVLRVLHRRDIYEKLG